MSFDDHGPVGHTRSLFLLLRRHNATTAVRLLHCNVTFRNIAAMSSSMADAVDGDQGIVTSTM